MYQALYRKYRPQTLEEVGGQDTIVKIIKNSIKTGKINHAYLFAGPRGTGKTSIAKIFAKMVNCQELKNSKPCGKCVSCLQKNNSDTIEIDAASNNGVDEIRELRNNVNLVPSYGKYKIYIIDEVHMLTTGAFNALLKTLEEPPAHIIFILATTDPHKIPETILSRCQRLDFKKISEKSIIERLKTIVKIENIEIEEEALQEIARLSDGGMRDSIGMLDQAIAYSEKKITIKDIHDINGTLTQGELKKLINNIIEQKIKEIFEILDKYNNDGKNFVKLTEEIITFFRNILLYKNAKEYFCNINSNFKIYEELSSKIKTKEILEYIKILNETLIEMKNTNNTKLLLELAIIKITTEENQQKNYQQVNNIQTLSSEIKQKIISPIDNPVEPMIPPKKEKTVENSQKSQEKNPKKQENLQKNQEKEQKLAKIKEIRIENTLAKFSKKQMIAIKEKLPKLNEYILDSQLSKYVSIILDGTLKAASDENLIFVYNSKRTSNLFNENLINIEKTLQKILNTNYKTISTDISHWEKIKNEFNSKKKEYKYKEEKIDIETILNKPNQNEFSEFQDIIIYK